MGHNATEIKQRAKILMVDDNPINLHIYNRFLENNNFELLRATSGKEALKLAEEKNPDLILLDIKMPEMNGYETCIHLKKNKKMAAIPVIFVSSDIQIEEKARAFEVGGQDFIPKPVQKEELIAHINIHLANKRLQENLAKEVNKKISLIHILTHDISNYLTVILGQAEFISTDIDSKKKSASIKKKLEKILISADKACVVIRSALQKGSG